MPLFKIKKTMEYKNICICGLNITLQRSRYKKEKSLYLPISSLKDNGVSLIGAFKENSGEATVAKNVLSVLEKSDIPYDFFNLNEEKAPQYKTKITFTTSYYYKPEIYRNISVLFWEFQSGMPEVLPYAFENIAGVITFSSFCQNYFQSIAPKNIPIFKLPYPFHLNKDVLLKKGKKAFIKVEIK